MRPTRNHPGLRLLSRLGITISSCRFILCCLYDWGRRFSPVCVSCQALLTVKPLIPNSVARAFMERLGSSSNRRTISSYRFILCCLCGWGRCSPGCASCQAFFMVKKCCPVKLRRQIQLCFGTIELSCLTWSCLETWPESGVSRVDSYT